MSRLHIAVTLLTLVAIVDQSAFGQSEPLAVKLAERDISISASTAGTFAIAYPALITGGDKTIAPAQIAKDAEGVTLVPSQLWALNLARIIKSSSTSPSTTARPETGAFAKSSSTATPVIPRTAAHGEGPRF